MVIGSQWKIDLLFLESYKFKATDYFSKLKSYDLWMVYDLFFLYSLLLEVKSYEFNVLKFYSLTESFSSYLFYSGVPLSSSTFYFFSSGSDSSSSKVASFTKYLIF